MVSPKNEAPSPDYIPVDPYIYEGVSFAEAAKRLEEEDAATDLIEASRQADIVADKRLGVDKAQDAFDKAQHDLAIAKNEQHDAETRMEEINHKLVEANRIGMLGPDERNRFIYSMGEKARKEFVSDDSHIDDRPDWERWHPSSEL